MKKNLRSIVFSAVSIFLQLILLGCGSKTETVGPRADYKIVAEDLQRVITHEMQDKALPAVSIALVDDQEIVWAQGFGFADRENKIPATAKTVYRVGSVSKLFTDIGIMQLVEEGALDLDAPITQVLPDFKPQNPFNKPITLRQLMSHRSGLVREPPVGHYFDPTEPTLAQTVQSLNATKLVYEPETRTKYSNAGISVVGYVLEHTQKKPFAEYLQQAVLLPMGLKKSAFAPTTEIRRHLAKAYMWAYDGREFMAPTFELGTAPAGSMYATVLDLSQFLRVLFNAGKGSGGQILQPETLAEMWQPQFAAPGQTHGFGLGFSISALAGHRQIGHGGAIYGFATQLYALPEEKLGVVVVTSMDAANTVMRRIANHALKSMLAVRAGQPVPKMQLTSPLEPELARRLDGTYQKGDNTVELVERDGQLFLWKGSFRAAVKALGDTLITDDRLAYGTKLKPVDADQIFINGEIYTRIPNNKPGPAPEKWRGLIGEYGWEHNTLFILEKNGQLCALIEWFFLYPLREISSDVYAFPDHGLYHGEQLIFKREESGRATEVRAAEVVFKRRPVGLQEGQTFKLEAIKPVEALRQTALAAQPPKEEGEFFEPELVDI
ncbi:MAG: serine hydrolase domain-containing protein, partial [bacterium]